MAVFRAEHMRTSTVCFFKLLTKNQGFKFKIFPIYGHFTYKTA